MKLSLGYHIHAVHVHTHACTYTHTHDNTPLQVSPLCIYHQVICELSERPNLLTRISYIWYSVPLSHIVRECPVGSGGCFEKEFLEQMKESQAALVEHGGGLAGRSKETGGNVEREITKLVMS